MKRQRGWGLIELLLGVTAGGVLVAFALTLYTSSVRKQALSEAQRDIGHLVENIEDGVGRVQSYHGFNTTQAVERGLVPPELLESGTARTRWGLIDLASTGPAHDGLRMTLQTVPGDVCSELAAALAPLSTEIRVGNAVLVRHFQAVPENMGACNEGGDLVLDRFIPGMGMKAQWETW